MQVIIYLTLLINTLQILTSGRHSIFEEDSLHTVPQLQHLWDLNEVTILQFQVSKLYIRAFWFTDCFLLYV